MRLRLLLLSTAPLVSWLCPPAVQASPTSAVIALHAKSHTTKGATACGTWAPNDIDCTEFNTRATTGTPYDVYVVGVNPLPPAGESVPSIAGIRWGIDYDGESHRGVDVFSWVMCGDLEFPMDDWPRPLKGNTLTWDRFENCQTHQPGGSGTQAIAGVFYIYAYSEDVFSVTPFFAWVFDGEDGKWIAWNPELELADCNGSPSYLDFDKDRGAVRFSSAGTAVGFNPCNGEGELPPYVVPGPPVPPPPPPPPTGEHPATILLHIAPAGPRAGSCADAPADLDSVRTSAPFSGEQSEYDVFLLATPEVPDDPVGIAAIQMGIEYSASLEILTWISCSSQIPYGDWPADGSGNSLFFDGCQSSEIEVAGYFRVAVSTPSLFKIVGHPLTGVAAYADCQGEQVLESLGQGQVGWISMGGAAIGQDEDGCNPAVESCAPGLVPARTTTWGRLKSKY